MRRGFLGIWLVGFGGGGLGDVVEGDGDDGL